MPPLNSSIKKKRRISKTMDDSDIGLSSRNRLRPRSKQEERAKTTDDVPSTSSKEPSSIKTRDRSISDSKDDLIPEDIGGVDSSRLSRFRSRTIDRSVRDSKRDLTTTDIDSASSSRLRRAVSTGDISDSSEVSPHWELRMKAAHKDWEASVAELKADVDKGNFVVITDNHSDEEPFSLARSIMKAAETKGTLLIEAPNSITQRGDSGLIEGLKEWEQGVDMRQRIRQLAEYAQEQGWKVVPIDATGMDGRLDRSLMRSTGVIKSEDEVHAGQTGSPARQNFIALKGQQAIRDAEGGGVLAIGTKHVTGSGSDVRPFSELVTHKRGSPELTSRLSGKVKTEVIDKESVKDTLPETEIEVSKRDRRMIQGWLARKKKPTLKQMAVKLHVDDETARQMISKVEAES